MNTRITRNKRTALLVLVLSLVLVLGSTTPTYAATATLSPNVSAVCVGQGMSWTATWTSRGTMLDGIFSPGDGTSIELPSDSGRARWGYSYDTAGTYLGELDVVDLSGRPAHAQARIVVQNCTP